MFSKQVSSVVSFLVLSASVALGGCAAESDPAAETGSQQEVAATDGAKSIPFPQRETEDSAKAAGTNHFIVDAKLRDVAGQEAADTERADELTGALHVRRQIPQPSHPIPSGDPLAKIETGPSYSDTVRDDTIEAEIAAETLGTKR